jgi:hypothetical protein
MVRQAFNLLSPPVGCERLNGLDQAPVQPSPSLQQQAAVCHLVRQGMLKGIDLLGEEPRLVEKLGGLPVGQTVVQRCFGHVCNGLE